MSKPGRAAEYSPQPDRASGLPNDPTIPEPTGSASRDGAATAPPANLDGASPAATAPEAPVPSTQLLVENLRNQLLWDVIHWDARSGR